MEQEQFSQKPTFNKEVVQTYIDILKKKYQELESDPFSLKARMSIRSEIEEMTAVLSEEEMKDTWKSLDNVFGIKPESRQAKQSRFQEQMRSEKLDVSEIID